MVYKMIHKKLKIQKDEALLQTKVHSSAPETEI